MNTPSKEALDASEAVQDYLGFPRRATMDLAAIIDRHFEPLRQRAERAEARVKELEATCAELVTDGNAVTLAANLAKQSARVNELAVALREKQENHPDTERIDWLESHPSKYDWGVTLDHGCVFAARNKTSGHDTLRAAIDAARKEVQP